MTIRKNKIILTLNKPAYVGMCILDLSKVLMYEFYYDYIKNKCYKNSRLLFSDTDSLMYEITSEDVYEDFSNDKEIFESKYYDESNKVVVGRMKDEAGGFEAEEIAALKPKMYLFLVDDRSEHKKANGVDRNFVKSW